MCSLGWEEDSEKNRHPGNSDRFKPATRVYETACEGGKRGDLSTVIDRRTSSPGCSCAGGPRPQLPGQLSKYQSSADPLP